MKRKKWSEFEEQTLLTKYSDLQTTGTLAKLKTREKKFKPIAEHVNSVHNLRDPIKFPFKWSWRDVSIKVQNMRHQYLGVKQKIRVSDSEYNWEDGENHWENFMKYKEVFGDIELELKDNKRLIDLSSDVFGDSGGDEFFGLGFHELHNNNNDDEEEEEDDDDSDNELEMSDDLGTVHVRKSRKGIDRRMLGLVGAQVLELRDVVMRREDKKRDREFRREECGLQREERKTESEFRETEFEERETARARREVRLETEFDEERRRRLKAEEKWEEEEMKWKEKMVTMQIQHEKQMMQLHANACQNQMQLLGVMARFFCQFFGPANDGLGNLVPQVLQNLQHPVPGGLDDDGKPDANLPSEFL